MLLFEHEGKALMRKFGIPVPPSKLVRTAADLNELAGEIDYPVMVKAQALTGGRGKAGGIRAAATASAAREHATDLLSARIKDCPVQGVLIEPQLKFDAERYMSVLLDGATIMLLFGSKGGVEVESYFGDQKSVFQSVEIDPAYGLNHYQVRNILESLGIDRAYWSAYAEIAEKLYRLFRQSDATLAEINPLVEVGGGKLMALDARIVVDDGALYRHPDFAAAEKLRLKEEGFLARLKELEIQYVPVGGNVGLVSSGAGVGVTIMDWLDQEGAKLSAFVDLDYAIMGGHTEIGIQMMLDAFCEDPGVKVIIVNFTTCGLKLDEIASSLVEAVQRRSGNIKPIFYHLVGNRSAAAHEILRNAGYTIAESLGDAVRSAARLAKGH
jgi:succinyl-CoA synthetase beta subunit